MDETSIYPNYSDQEKMVYTITEVKELLGLSIRQTYNLLHKEQFPIIRAVRKKLIPIKSFHQWVEKNYPYIELPEYYEMPIILRSDKKSFSVPEVRAMLGMKKTSSYEMIKAGTFKTIIIRNEIRILSDSFYQWFHSQDHLFVKEQEGR